MQPLTSPHSLALTPPAYICLCVDDAGNICTVEHDCTFENAVAAVDQLDGGPGNPRLSQVLVKDTYAKAVDDSDSVAREWLRRNREKIEADELSFVPEFIREHASDEYDEIVAQAEREGAEHVAAMRSESRAHHAAVL